MVSMVFGDSTLEYLTPSVNAPLGLNQFLSICQGFGRIGCNGICWSGMTFEQVGIHTYGSCPCHWPRPKIAKTIGRQNDFLQLTRQATQHSPKGFRFSSFMGAWGFLNFCCSHCVLNLVLNVFLNMFSIALHFTPYALP